MDRTDAEQVFRLVADLRGDLRERLVHDRWWLVWVAMGVQTLITNSVTQLLINHGETRLWFYSLVWGTQIVLLALTIRLAHRRAGGLRSQRETFIWWIWTTFLLCGIGVAVLNTLQGLPIFFTAPVIPLLAAFGFSMMAMAVHRAFVAGTVLFLICVILMTLLPRVQFFIYGIAWCVVLELMGFYFRPRAVVPGRPL